ncbi:MAG: hypothetical protein O3C40_08295 [Planctomycetota bacterium]|nr:hypothetical protein [Planctomycetota bacterium]
MRDDPVETTNLADEHPEIVRQLTTLAAKYVTDGRSTPGPRQAYVSTDWSQLDRLPTE